MGKPDPRKRNGNARRKLLDRLRAQVAAQGLPCHLCGMPIDTDLPSGHPMCLEADEIVPVSRGGNPLDPANVAPAHRSCNQRRGNKPLWAVRPVEATDETSRDW